MRKFVVPLTLFVVIVFSLGIALADNVTGLTTFTRGTPAIAASVNANFSEIENSVNDNYTRLSNTKILRDGVTTVLKGRVPIPPAIAPGSAQVSVYLRGCAGSAMRMGHYWEEISMGNNPVQLVTWDYGTLNMPSADPNSIVVDTYTFTFLVGGPLGHTFGTDSLFSFGIRREGGDAADTCSSDATLYGVKFKFPALSVGFWPLWLPPSDLD